MIGAFGDDDMGDQPLGRQAALARPTLLLWFASCIPAGGIHRSPADRRGHRSASPPTNPERLDHQIHSAERIRRLKAIGPFGLA